MPFKGVKLISIYLVAVVVVEVEVPRREAHSSCREKLLKATGCSEASVICTRRKCLHLILTVWMNLHSTWILTRARCCCGVLAGFFLFPGAQSSNCPDCPSGFLRGGLLGGESEDPGRFLLEPARFRLLVDAEKVRLPRRPSGSDICRMELLDLATSGRSVPSTELELLDRELRELHFSDGEDSRVYL